MTNCKNCGAILKYGECLYCGTIYTNNDTEEIYNRLDMLKIAVSDNFSIYSMTTAATNSGYYNNNKTKGM